MPVAEWFPAYADTVRKAFRSGLLPADPDDPFWRVMEEAFRNHGVTHGAAERALFTLESPPEFPVQIRTAIIGTARAILKQDAAMGPGGAELDKDAAEAASKGCEECSGCGMTSRFVWSKRFGMYVSAGCICHQCASGRWIARQWQGQNGARPFDLADHPALWDEALKFSSPGEVVMPDLDTTGMSHREIITAMANRPKLGVLS
jgi:hypothetical protein